ncbi:CbiQ family ECF transporter T component [Berryella wangjianweii]|uniref:CbiQ family ECF transporter T component n=1 Tax=Berryella wangjianweii TaxID=2734634 RepID=UPI0028F7201C|nr:CbiQ family ECF transporter T component [Berryella wangjianweii]
MSPAVRACHTDGMIAQPPSYPATDAARGARWLQRADARLKAVLLAAASAAVFFIQTPGGIVAALAVAVAVAATGCPQPRRVVALAAPGLALCAFGFAYALVTGPSLIEGAASGLVIAGRMAFLLVASAAVSLSTPSSDALAAFQRLLGPLRRFGMPVDAMATVFSLALAFIPRVFEEIAIVRSAHASRAAAFGAGLRALPAWGRVLTPVFVRLFRHADALALAMDARAFGLGERRTALGQRPLAAGERAILAAGVALCVAAALLL